jgi:AcrR family transcriptional regulator
MRDMDKCRYRQKARAVSSEATRQRILAAARETLERGPLGALKVEEVALAAGVSRSTVYLLYGSRAGLFDALARQLRDEAGFESLLEAVQRPDALDAFRAAQRAAVAAYASMPDLARALFTLGATDPDAVAAVRAIEDGRVPGQTRIAQRLAEQGYLRAGITVAEAAEMLSVITSFDAFDELFEGRGLPVDTVADRLVAMGERSVCRSDIPRETSRRRRATPRRGGGRSPA